MKLVILLLMSLIGHVFFAQNVAFDLKVFTTKGQPDKNREVVFIESSTYEHLAFKTNSSGQLHVEFDHGSLWLGSVGDMRNCIEVNVRGNGRSSQTITYDPIGYARKIEPRPDRRSYNFEVIDQDRIYPGEQPTRNESIISIVLQDRNGKYYSKVPVTMTCFATNRQYTSMTNTRGAALFKLPINQKYEIDVDGVESLSWLDLGPHPQTSNLQLLYQPRTFKEEKEDRFIVQNVHENVQPSSSHARVKLKVNKDGLSAIDEDVYIRMLKSNNVYRAKTNDQGEVLFMLPLRQQYFVEFPYQREADILDLSKMEGIGYMNKTVDYIPDPRLTNIENFIPSVEELIAYDINEFINKVYPEPLDGDIGLQLKWGTPITRNSKEALLEIGLKVKSTTNRKTSKPLNICFVIDKSGSMIGEDRIEQVKKSLIRFVQQLDSTDYVSIVVFDDQSTVAVPAAAIGDKKKIIDIIYAIRSGGGTNIYKGLEQGFNAILSSKKPGMIERVVLLTDGYGSVPPEEVVKMAKSNIAKGIELSTIGVGTDYNQALLGQLASAGGGLLHLAGNSNNIDNVFQRELESILYPMANKAQLIVRYNEQIVYRQLYGYSNEKIENGFIKLELEHLFPGLDKLLLAKFDLHNPTPDIVKENVEVELSYTDAVTNKPVILKKSIKPDWKDIDGSLDFKLEKEHQKIIAISNVNQLLKVMVNSFESGDKQLAEQSVRDAIAQLTKLYPQAMPEDIIAITTRLQSYVDAFEYLRLNKTY